MSEISNHPERDLEMVGLQCLADIADELRYVAEWLRDGHTLGGEWHYDDARRKHDKLLAWADALDRTLDLRMIDGLQCLADIRAAVGDSGQMMQSELVERIRGLRKDTERYRWMRNHQPESLQGGELVEASEDPFIAAHLVDKWGDVYELIGDDLDKEIDAAMAKEARDA